MVTRTRSFLDTAQHVKNASERSSPWKGWLVLATLVLCFCVGAWLTATDASASKRLGEVAEAKALEQLYGTSAACYGSVTTEKKLYGTSGQSAYRVTVTLPGGQRSFCDCDVSNNGKRLLSASCACWDEAVPATAGQSVRHWPRLSAEP